MHFDPDLQKKDSTTCVRLSGWMTGPRKIFHNGKSNKSLLFDWMRSWRWRTTLDCAILSCDTVLAWYSPCGYLPDLPRSWRWRTTLDCAMLFSPDTLLGLLVGLLANTLPIRGRVFAYSPGDQGSVWGRVISKTQKMVLDISLINTQH